MRKIIRVLFCIVSIGVSISIAWYSIAWYSIPDLSTRVYVCFQIGVFVGILWWWKYWSTHTNTVASILTVIGVFGTFLGIFIGLQAFEIENIEASIPGLLEGLKLAFLTSLVGIGSAILLKGIGIVAPLFRKFQKGKNPIDVERDKFIGALKGIETSGETNLRAQLVTLNTTIKKEGSETRKTLDNIKTHLDGIHTSLTEEEGATFKQLHHLTTTFSNKHEELIRSQTKEGRETRDTLNSIKTEITGIKEALIGEDESTVFAQLQELTETVSEKVGEIAAKVGEIATGQLIEALREVIRDFNKNLTEQFGENFKQLNEAVGRTVEWQEQYRQQMDELANEFRIAAQSVEQSRVALASAAESLTTIEDQSDSLVSIAEKLDPILHTLNDQLEAFSELRQRAHEAFPLIENRLNDLTASFSNTVKTTIANSHKSMETQRAALATQGDELRKTVGDTTQQFEQLTTRFSGSVETSIADSHNSMNKQREELTARFSSLEIAINAALETTTQQLTTMTTDFSEAVKTSITESQVSMNKQREELTARFSDLENAMNAANQQLRKTVNGISKQLDSVFERSANHMENTLKEFTNEIHGSLEKQREAFEAHSRTFQTTLNEISGQVNAITRNVSENVNQSQVSMNQQRQELVKLTQQLQENFRELENTLEADLTRSLQLLAGHLAALSKKFVDDYTPLTEELYRLVNLVRNNTSHEDTHSPPF